MVQWPCSSHLFNKVSYSAWLTQPRLKWPLSLVYTAHVGVSFGQTSILIWLSQSFSSLPSQEGHWIPSNTEEKKKCRETYREFNFGNRLRDKKKKNRLIFPFFPWRIIGWESGFSAERLVNKRIQFILQNTLFHLKYQCPFIPHPVLFITNVDWKKGRKTD